MDQDQYRIGGNAREELKLIMENVVFKNKSRREEFIGGILRLRWSGWQLLDSAWR